MKIIKYLSKLQLIYNFLSLNDEFTNKFNIVKYAGGKSGLEVAKDTITKSKNKKIDVIVLTKNKNLKEGLNKEDLLNKECELTKLVKDDLPKDIYKSKSPNLNNDIVVSIDLNDKNNDISLDNYQFKIEESFRDMMYIFKQCGLRGSQKHEYHEIIQIIALQDALKDNGILYYYPMGDHNNNAPDLLYETTDSYNKTIQIPIQLKSLHEYITEKKIDHLNYSYRNTDIIFLSVKEWLIKEQIFKLESIEPSKLDKYILMSIDEKAVSNNLNSINLIIESFARNNLSNPQVINEYLLKANSILEQVKVKPNLIKQEILLNSWKFKYNVISNIELGHNYELNNTIDIVTETSDRFINKSTVDSIELNNSIKNQDSNELLYQKVLSAYILKTQFIIMKENSAINLESPASLRKSMIKKDLYFKDNSIPNRTYLHLIDNIINKDNNND